MKFSIPSNVLLDIVQSVYPAVEKRGTLPILNNILVKINEDKLTMTATDLSVEITKTVDCGEGIVVATTGETTIPAKKLYDISKLIDGTVKVSNSKEKMTISCGKSKFTLLSTAAEDFPTWSFDNTAKNKITVNAKDITEALRKVRHAIAVNDVRYYINGVCFDLSGDNLNLVATDGHRLAIEQIPAQSDSPINVIVPANAVNYIINLLQKTDDDVIISCFNNGMLINKEDTALSFKFVDGKFPDYNRVIPKSDSRRTVCTINKDETVKAVARASLTLDSVTSGILLNFNGGECEITGSSNSESSEEIIDADVKGEPVKIGLNAKYTLSAIESMDGDSIIISFDGIYCAALLTTNNNPSSKRVVMPMRI